MIGDRQDIGVLLSLAQVAFQEQLVADLDRQGYDGFTPRTGFVLRLLAEEPLPLARLAERLLMSPQATVKLVDLMTSHGYVERFASDEDGRLRLVAVSDRGRQALAAAHAFHERFELDLGERLGVAGAAVLREALELLAGQTAVVVPGGVRRATRGGD
ncbi:MarR family transcriptional regulator [Nocardioides sp. YIM 152588]|uniref:MarR family winged helix-turn-helix transcriptional regulator n=1 Tax=Nocardioides sp. YIM 152588 TaxID=3158259 RepID=UPI0032E42EDF